METFVMLVWAAGFLTALGMFIGVVGITFYFWSQHDENRRTIEEIRSSRFSQQKSMDVPERPSRQVS